MPTDLKLAGEQETFTITVTYETLDLYGEIQGARQITVKAE